MGSWQRVLFLKVNQETVIFADGTDQTDLLLIPGVSYSSLPPNFLTGWVRDAAYYVELTGSPQTLGSDASYLRFVGRARKGLAHLGSVVPAAARRGRRELDQ